MDIIISIIIIVITLIFVFIIGYVFYEIFTNNANKKYQTIYFLNNPFYNKGHSSKNGKYHCPRGCDDKGICSGASLCYNCAGDNPQCCCYNVQCAGCIKK
jgi:hypothetical protein